MVNADMMTMETSKIFQIIAALLLTLSQARCESSEVVVKNDMLKSILTFERPNFTPILTGFQPGADPGCRAGPAPLVVDPSPHPGPFVDRSTFGPCVHFYHRCVGIRFASNTSRFVPNCK